MYLPISLVVMLIILIWRADTAITNFESMQTIEVKNSKLQYENSKLEVEKNKLEYERMDRELHPLKYMTEEEIKEKKKIELEQLKIDEQYRELENFDGL